MKAWKCTDCYNCAVVIVMAETRGQARAFGRSGLDAEQFTDVLCSRLPAMDDFRPDAGTLQWDCDDRAYWMSGFIPWDDMEVLAPQCAACGRGDFESIPESHVDSLTGICRDCKEATP